MRALSVWAYPLRKIDVVLDSLWLTETMKQIPNQFLMAVLASVVGLLVTNAWLGYENIEQMRQGSLTALRNRSVIVALENIISLITKAESGQRGYLITGEPKYLEPYRKTLAKIDGQIKFLEHATANNPAQQARIPELKRRIESRLQQLQQRIDLRAGKGIDAARQAILVNAARSRWTISANTWP
jgi:CHASE3 domain sensor protein